MSTLEKNTQQPQYTLDHNQDNIEINVALPAVNKENIQLVTKQDKLTLTASRQIEIADGWQLLSSTPPADHFELTLEIDPEFESTKISATFNQQILKLNIPKKTSSSRSIPIK